MSKAMPNFKPYSFKTISSTNDKAKELAKKGKSNIVVVAENQEKGRGRFGREWKSEPGGLYMTIILKEKSPDKIKYLTFMASVAVAESIKQLTKLNALVKWPNDVLINNKKACGILTEIISGKENYALVGIGLNVNQTKFNKDISNKATSLKLIANKNYDLNEISKAIINNFNLLYDYYENKNYEKIIDLWKERSHTLGKKIRAETVSGTYLGKAVGIDKDCSLILKLEEGGFRKIVEGDIFTV